MMLKSQYMVIFWRFSLNITPPKNNPVLAVHGLEGPQWEIGQLWQRLISPSKGGCRIFCHLLRVCPASQPFCIYPNLA